MLRAPPTCTAAKSIQESRVCPWTDTTCGTHKPLLKTSPLARLAHDSNPYRTSKLEKSLRDCRLTGLAVLPRLEKNTLAPPHWTPFPLKIPCEVARSMTETLTPTNPSRGPLWLHLDSLLTHTHTPETRYNLPSSSPPRSKPTVWTVVQTRMATWRILARTKTDST